MHHDLLTNAHPVLRSKDEETRQPMRVVDLSCSKTI